MKIFEKTTVQLVLAFVLAIAGMTMLFLGFYAIPVGAIDATVLTAFGEVATFSAGLMGIDYTYKYKITKIDKEDKK